MNINKRQTSLLFELISTNNTLSYEYLENFFDVSRRTILEDVKCLNDLLEPGIQISYQKNQGFFLAYENKELLDRLKEKLNVRYSDVWEIHESMEGYYYRCILYFLMSHDYIKVDDLANLFNVNRRSVSNLLKEVRHKLSRYQLKLITTPHHGMILEGREVHRRYYILDLIYRYSLELKDLLFDEDLIENLYEKRRSQLRDAVRDYIQKTGVELSQSSISKLLVLLIVSMYRVSKGFEVDLKEEEIQLFKEFEELVHLDVFMQKIENIYQIKISENEKIFIGIYILTHLETYHKHPKLKNYFEPVLNELLKDLEKEGISNEHSRIQWRKGLSHIIKQAVLTNLFDIYERSPNTVMKKAVKNSPLSSVIGNRCFDFLQGYFNNRLGESIFVSICLAVYSCIFKIDNNRRMNSIAILTPLDKSYGETLKTRVYNRYSNVINKIEVVSFSDLMTDKMKEFDTLVYCSNIEHIQVLSPIKTIKVDFFFKEEDVRNFYEQVVVPSRSYKRAFGKMYSEDYIVDYPFTSFESLIEKEIKPYCSENLAKQVDEFQLDEYVISNRTLNIVLFAKSEEEMFSKMIFLRNAASIGSVKFARIFVHSIKLDGDLIKLKTTEKVLRNLTSFNNTSYDIGLQCAIDYYDYYIFDKKILLQSKENHQK